MINNSNLYGNATAWHNLVNDSLTNHIAHAYIFAGPKGVGKALVAKEYIKYILKANDTLAERIDEDSFLDLLYIHKQDKSEIGIDSIRNAGDFFKHTPTEGDKKFVIIDSADDLNLNSANALLKILEEPTQNTYLFLISHTPYKLLSTIRSRCRMIKFQPLDAKDLKLIANMGKISVMEDFIAGSAARAIACHEMDVIKLYQQILELIQSDDIMAFNKFTETITKKTEQWQLVTELLLYLLNRCLKIASNCLQAEEISEIEVEIAKNKSIDEWFKIYDEFTVSLKQAEIYNLDKKQVLLLIMNEIRKS